MYDIGIPEIKINSRLEDTNHISIRYEAEASERPHYCTNPRCGHQIIPHIHSSKNNLIRDIFAPLCSSAVISLSIEFYSLLSK